MLHKVALALQFGFTHQDLLVYYHKVYKSFPP